MSSRVKTYDISKQNMTSATALFGAGAVLLAGSLAAALVAGPAQAKPLDQPYVPSTPSYTAPPAPTQPYAAPAAASPYAAPAKALGDRVARAATQAYTAYQGAAHAASGPHQYAASASAPLSATHYADAWNKAQAEKAEADKLAPTMVFFSAPIRGFSINSGFGLRKLSNRGHARPHEGVDFAAPIGSPVLSAAPGRVLRTGNSSTYGRFVEVEHPNGVTSFYAHLSAINVQAGDALGAGDGLGKVGTTGRSTGPHLHFEIRRNGQQVDPTGFLGRQFAPESSGFLYRIVHNEGGGMAGNLRGVAAAQ